VTNTTTIRRVGVMIGGIAIAGTATWMAGCSSDRGTEEPTETPAPTQQSPAPSSPAPSPVTDAATTETMISISVKPRRREGRGPAPLPVRSITVIIVNLISRHVRDTSRTLGQHRTSHVAVPLKKKHRKGSSREGLMGQHLLARWGLSKQPGHDKQGSEKVIKRQTSKRAEQTIPVIKAALAEWKFTAIGQQIATLPAEYSIP